MQYYDFIFVAIALTCISYVSSVDQRQSPNDKWWERSSWQNNEADAVVDGSNARRSSKGGQQRQKQQHNFDSLPQSHGRTAEQWPVVDGSGNGPNVDLDSSWPTSGRTVLGGNEDVEEGSGGGLGVDDEDAPLLGAALGEEKGSGNGPSFVDPPKQRKTTPKPKVKATTVMPELARTIIDEDEDDDSVIEEAEPDNWWTTEDRQPGFTAPAPLPITTTPTIPYWEITTTSTTTTSTQQSTTTTTTTRRPVTITTEAPLWSWSSSSTSSSTPPQIHVVEDVKSIYDTPTGTEPASIQRRFAELFLKPGILAAVIGGAVVGLLAAILLVFFIVYRMRKKDEGSYALDEPKSPSQYGYAYQKAPTKEFYA